MDCGVHGVALILIWCGRNPIVGSLVAWGGGNKGRRWYALSLLSYVLAMASKESVWILPALMCLVGIMERVAIRRVLVSVSPFALLASAYALWILDTKSSNGRFKDGSFSLHAPWLASNLDSLWHLLVIWGILALAVIVTRRGVDDLRIAGFSCGWMALSLLPYSFLTYMPRVPSRQTYLASLGLAWLVATALERIRPEFPRISAIAMTAVVLINVEILWVKKLGQFRERAEPTELLRAAARRAAGPVHVAQIPVDPMVARAALEDDHHTAIVDEVESRADAHRFSIWYVDRSGAVNRVDTRIGTARHGLFW